MESQTLFGELALRLSAHPENVATEALLYILERHASALPSLRTYLSRTTVELPDALTFRSQTWSEELAQPDLIGTNDAGESSLIVEVKFWAGLTENQPVTYLRGLPQDAPGILLFVCPAKRLASLWDKLVFRLEQAAVDYEQVTRLESGFLYCSVGEQHLLVALTWTQLLGVLRREAETANDYALLSDASQLQGLCDKMDSQAFLPLRPEDLGADVAMRIQHWADLVDDIVAELVRNHRASTKGLSTGGRQSAYGRYFRLNGFELFFQYSPSFWARFGDTPYWLQLKYITDEGAVSPPWLSEGLDRLPSGRFYRIPHIDGPNTIGLDVPLGVERDAVLSQLTMQVNEVVAAVMAARPSKLNNASC